MSMPRIPKAKHRPTLEETIIDLLESIALEEISLSHLMNAEAEKVQAFIGKDADFPFCSNYKEIITFNQSVNQLMDTMVMKEWLLLKKLEHVRKIEVRTSDFCGKYDDTSDMEEIDSDDEVESDSGDWL